MKRCCSEGNEAGNHEDSKFQTEERDLICDVFPYSCYLSHGVPQGSVLFLLFNNDLLQAVQEAEVVLFMDDTNILLIEKELMSLRRKILKVMK
jgi:hypothetical protein